MDILRLTPACKSYIWGGRRLIDEYDKKTDELITEFVYGEQE